MEDNTCPKCNVCVLQTRKNAMHLELYCPQCGHIKFLAQPIQDFVMPFGKYAGVKMVDIPLDYLQWGFANIEKKNIKEKCRDAIKYKMTEGI